MLCNRFYRVYFLLISIGVSQCTVICDACRPIDIVNSPGETLNPLRAHRYRSKTRTLRLTIYASTLNLTGIGIDLALGYGVAVLHYGNGTTVDVAKIEGDEAYVNAMKWFAEESLLIPNPGPDSDPWARKDIPAFAYPPGPPINDDIKFWQGIFDGTIVLNQTEEKTPERPPPPYTRPGINLALLPEQLKIWVEAVSPLISALKTQVDAVHKLAYPAISLSIPDFCFHLSSCRANFGAAAHAAGFDTILPTMFASEAAIYQHPAPQLKDLSNYLEDEDEVLDSIVEEALVVDYSQAAISVTLLKRFGKWLNTLEPTEFYMEPKLGAYKLKGLHSDGEYAQELQDWIESSFNWTILNRAGYLVLTGDAGTSFVIHDVLFLVLKGNTHISWEDYHLSDAEYTFGRARAMAKRAWKWMTDEHDGCLPSGWCPK
ncbi:hypothetical protein TWF718_006562 [Orbilia javanica]|uniref:Uncharacterized protein n=1 Tax=Orbilia javanica TaxID=47235 RepID=A0AAN8RHT5_9PEZI